MSQKLWGGRFQSQTSPLVDEYTSSIGFDHVLADVDIQGSIAHAKMLAKCQIISETEAQQIVVGLDAILTDIHSGKVKFRLSDEDIHMNVERLLTEKIGPVAGKLHTARSRNDQVALDLHLYVRHQMGEIIDLISSLQNTLLSLAKKHASTLMPGYTHLQRAQPIYLAQHLLAYVSMFERDVARFRDTFKRTNISPLGAAALAGTTLPIDKHFVAAALNFDGCYQNTIDAVSDRDFVIEFVSNASLLMMHVSRFSEELILWSSHEFHFISFDDAFSTGSSIMPQKKNPDVAELARGKTSRVYGALITLLTLMKALPLAYNKDMQEDKEPLFDVVKTVKSTLSIFVPLLNTMTVNADVMANAASEGYLNATALAEYCVKQGMPFRAAHEAVGKLVAHAMASEASLQSLALTEIQQFIPVATAAVYQILNGL